MSSISAYGATIKVTQAGVYITPSRLAQALEHIPHLVPIDRITGATELSPPTAYGLGEVELTGTTEVIRFAPGGLGVDLPDWGGAGGRWHAGGLSRVAVPTPGRH